jgi:hypothetical protein
LVLLTAVVASCTCDPQPSPGLYACKTDDDCAEQRCIAGVCGGLPDAGVDAGAADSGLDAGVSDAGPDDAGPADAGIDDAGPGDAGSSDAGANDAGTPDAGENDAGTHDAGAVDAGPGDAGCVGAVSINAGGPQVGAFLADTLVDGGDTYIATTPVDISGVTNPAPADVYRSERYGQFSYTLPGLTPNGAYLLRLHFAEIYWSDAGERIFDVQVNGSTVLSAFDIIAASGGPFVGIVREFPVKADSRGQLQVDFMNSAVDLPKLSGLELECAP